MTATDKLFKALESAITIKEGKVLTNKDGQKYRYDEGINKYQSTPYFLELLWNNAVKENGNPHGTHFFYKEYSFSFRRAIMKGDKHGNIQYTKLVKL